MLATSVPGIFLVIGHIFSVSLILFMWDLFQLFLAVMQLTFKQPRNLLILILGHVWKEMPSGIAGSRGSQMSSGILSLSPLLILFSSEAATTSNEKLYTHVFSLISLRKTR